MAIKVVTDSTSYLPRHLRDELDISVVSLSVNFEHETYAEEQIDNDAFYRKMAQSPEIPTSSQPTPQDFYDVFERLVREGHAVVGVFISSDMSGTYSTALAAKDRILEMYPDARIEIVDSRSNCMELGFVVLAAARAAQAGEPMDEVLARARSVINKSRFLFVPDTLEYLKKGGRIGGAAALLGTILQIRPILTVIDGKTEVFGKVRTKARAVQKIISVFLEDIERRGLGEVVVHHINDEAKGRDLAALLQEKLKRAVPVYSIGPVIGLHVGPGSVGVAYYTKE